MFANLKKKIEEEVGDLGRLTSPINLTGVLGDRRVGSSTQGTNTPSNLGSRQSSVASLIGLDITPERPAQSRLNVPNSNSVTREPVNSEELQQLKKQNADLKTKLDALKKSFEEKIQHQEADFAWKYNMKDDELTHLKSERDRMRDQLKVTENSWQEKYMRVATELENLEGLSKQENAKVKHLLLNTQNDLQGALRRVAEMESASKNKRDRDTANLMLAASSGDANVQTDETQIDAVQSSDNNHDESFLKRIKELEEENEKLKVSAEVDDSRNTKEIALEQQLNSKEEELHRKDQENDALRVQLAKLQRQLEESARLEVTRKSEGDIRIAEIKNLEASMINFKEMSEMQTEQLRKCIEEKEDMQNQIKAFCEAVENKETEITVLAKDQAQRNQKINFLEQELNTLKMVYQEKIKQVESLETTLKDLSARNADIIAGDLEVQHKVESDLNTVLSELNEAKSIIDSLTKERDAAQLGLEKLKEAHTKKEEEFSRFKQESVQEAELRRDELTRLKQSIALSVEETQSLNDQFESANLIKVELERLQREVQIFREEFSSAVPGANNVLSGLGNTPQDFKIFRQFVLEQTSLPKRLEDEMRQLKEEANAEVLSLQNKTDKLVSDTIQELKETKAKLIVEVEKSRGLATQMKLQETAAKELAQKFEILQNKCKEQEGELDRLTLENKSNDATVQGFEKRCASLQSTIDELEALKQRRVNEVGGLNDQLQRSFKHVSVLEKELESTKEELRNRSSQSEQESAKHLLMQKQLQKEKEEYFSKICEVEKMVTQQNLQLEIVSKQLREKEIENSELQTKVEQASAQGFKKDEDIRLFESRAIDLQNELTNLQASVAAIIDESAEKNSRIEELENQIEQQRRASTDALSAAENTIITLKEDLRKQEIMITEESNKVLTVRREMDRLNNQLSEAKSMVTNLQDEKDSFQTQVEELSVLKSLAEEEAKTSSDRSAELYNEVTELKKSLRTSRQQLSELKKSVSKEMKAEASTHATNNTSTGGSMEEVSLTDSAQQNDNPYSEVNFLYLRSVLFKYLTASDPQVASSLIKVVATLLELRPEEEKLLKETQESQSRWFNSLIKK